MLSLLKLNETIRRLREGDWSSKNDLLCLLFFFLVEASNAYYYEVDLITPSIARPWGIVLTGFFIWVCWRHGAGNRGDEFARRFLAIYRCHCLRFSIAVWSFVVFCELFLGALNIIFEFPSLDWVISLKPFGELNKNLLDGRGLSIFVLPSYLSVGDFAKWSVVLYFWRSVQLSMRQLSTSKPLLALPQGSESLPDFSE